MNKLLGTEARRPPENLTAEADRKSPDSEGKTGRVLDLLLILTLSLIFMFGVVRPFVAEVFRIPSESMAPTLEAGDRVLVNKFVYRFTEPERGDLVLFEEPVNEGPLAIKRVVGLPGDKVAVWDGVLFVNGERREEFYVDYQTADSTFFGPERVPEDHMLVMGDNRANSLDSRSFGAVPDEDVLGKVSLRLWPLGRTGAL
ncbi:MAG: signal peptidase I [Rubrobacteraceae bacterium]